MGREISTEVTGLQADVLDHSREFVDVVFEAAPGEYRELLNSPRFQRLLAEENAFNHGKLFAYAEYLVFRREFMTRFTEAKAHACINAFSKLFLKNDISITNLVNYLEQGTDKERTMLEKNMHPGKTG